ncbi:MAG: 16S rRNA (adenine(1518)-N(6)/adenine(1519)-N(6))-dimethyltransferase RsmA [Lachnospiraceae bacterium]|nr:16S rRNA (adenine(1518)-N(6)/adenine(1519)-N(6))-dimethyltransferase RsmA [Lachnospiraceae bacterium]
MNLSDSRDVRDLMRFYGISAQKKYGQNFLIDDGILTEIADSSGIDKEDTVLEIGPGLGALTLKLAERAKRVIAVEIDDALIPVLEGTLSDAGNIELIHADILKCDIEDLNEKYADKKGLKVVANLPYYITTPIVLKLLEYSGIIRSITVMVQKEVADRMRAVPGSKDYGALSLAVGYYADPNIVTYVSADSFFPSPAVDSAVIKLDAYEVPPVETADVPFMFKVIRATFNMRRKTLPNALCAGGLGLSRDSIEEALEVMGKSKTIRGETFTLEEFARISTLLYKHI